MKRNNLLSIVSISLGILQSLIFCYNYYFVSYFSSIGLSESLCTLGFGLMMILGGVTNFKYPSIGRALLWGCIIGGILERLLVSLLYLEYVTFELFIMPLVSFLVIGYLLLKSRTGFAISKNNLGLSFIIAIVIAILPKLIW